MNASGTDRDHALQRIFPGDGALASHLRATDWTATSLGAPERWPATMRSAMSTLLGPLEQALMSPSGADQARWSAFDQSRPTRELDTILDLLPVGVWRADRACEHIVGNRAAYEMLDLPLGINASISIPTQLPAEIAAIKFLVNGEEVAPEDMPIQRAALRGESVCHIMHQAVMPEGDVRVIDANVEPLRDGYGELCGAVAAYHDITELKRVETALRESEIQLKVALEAARGAEERFRHYFEFGLIGMAITSPSKGCLEVNDKVCEILGYERGELLQMTWAQITHPDDLAADVASFNQVLAGKIDAYAIDKRFIRKDGQVIDATISVRCLRLTDGSVDHFVALLQDITERKRAEEALRRAHEQSEQRVVERTQQLTARNAELTREMTERRLAEEALHKAQADLARVARVTSLGELATSIAHEVNQPLAAIVANGGACLRWLVREVPDLKETQRSVERIIQDGHRAAEVIARIRKLTKNSESQKGRININDTIQEVLALTREELRRNEVALRLELTDDLPYVVGDRVQLQQVVLNLTMNGIEAMSNIDDRPRELVISTRKGQGDALHIEMQDSGIGFGEQDTERLFEAFYTTKLGGTGIGLSISRTIVEAHGGRIWVTSNDGPGARAQFTLPTAAPATRDPTDDHGE
jgi:PAS domain S-box-containing protein